MKTDLMKKFDKLKQEVRDNLKDIELKAKQALTELEKLESGPRGHIEKLIKEIIERSQ